MEIFILLKLVVIFINAQAVLVILLHKDKHLGHGRESLLLLMAIFMQQMLVVIFIKELMA